jgi:hypothetical protein
LRIIPTLKINPQGLSDKESIKNDNNIVIPFIRNKGNRTIQLI